MNYLTLPANYANGIATLFERVDINPIRTTITFEFEEEIPDLLDLLNEAKESKENFYTHKELMDHLMD